MSILHYISNSYIISKGYTTHARANPDLARKFDACTDWRQKCVCLVAIRAWCNTLCLARQNGRNSRQHHSLVIGPVGLGPAMDICQKSQSNCSKPVCVRMMKCVSCLLLSVTPGCGWHRPQGADLAWWVDWFNPNKFNPIFTHTYLVIIRQVRFRGT